MSPRLILDVRRDCKGLSEEETAALARDLARLVVEVLKACSIDDMQTGPEEPRRVVGEA